MTAHVTTAERAAMAREIWAAYCEDTHRRGHYLYSLSRQRLIERRLSEYPYEDVLDAVRGWRYVAWNAGDNPGKRVYNDLELLLRDARHVEAMRDAYRGRPLPQRPPVTEALLARECVAAARGNRDQALLHASQRGVSGYAITRALDEYHETHIQEATP